MSKRQKQLSFAAKGLEKPKVAFGGHSFKTNAKSKRPISSKLPIHLVMRTDGRKFSMRKPRAFRIVDRIVDQTAEKYRVRIYEFANVGNHLHMVIKLPHLREWAKFIRELSGRIAQEMQELRGPEKGEKFWIFKPFTRVVASWGKAYRDCCDYVILNRLEGEGHICRSATKRLSELRALFGWRVT
jgi:REP element-mobilizing transposase RayT